ncbi:FHA domain-containing protein [Vibrio furnissii]|uniref:type VI secretion system-associated FHA domain protein n=1 Tax=Vibrio furnissii TaxID=29494 RepID=UPI0024BBB5FD|nr:FHA domain-containing protein [Vibrio furnissii]WHR53326.1 FHA domain-containing protein [Vibrio furnissii]
MTISFQIIDLPEDEQIGSRQVSLPVSGGTLGRSFECTIQLPDFQRTLSRVHADIQPHPKGGYQIIDRSTNGVFVNDVLVGKGESQRLSDGDRIVIGAYTLLVSDMDALLTRAPQQSDDTETASLKGAADSPFAASTVLDSQDTAFGFAHLDEIQDAVQDETPFSTENVLGDDLYGYDPFEDDERWVLEQSQSEDTTEQIVLMPEATQFNDNNHAPQHSVTVSDHRQIESLENSIEQLNSMLKQQQLSVAGGIDRERLMTCIESTLDKFLDNFNPSHLEDEFNDYLSGWGNKDKKYWALYKKQFQRKTERREFSRQFSSLLFEALREKR